mgnify:CR=1 FL=1
MNTPQVIDHIVSWLTGYIDRSGLKGFTVGVSGGIDSAVTSTLCAKTGKPVIALNMPIHQEKDQISRSESHIQWLESRFGNASGENIDLTPAFDQLKATFPEKIQDGLTMANTRSRLRMLTLYAYASNNRMLVAGTGNKVEDFGVGFYTKYGDGGVDLSPIADLMKTQVYALAKELGIIEAIQKATPTDGLWEDGRSDESQIGATYAELEWAMDYLDNPSEKSLTGRQEEVIAIYKKFHTANRHKMEGIPVCRIPRDLME